VRMFQHSSNLAARLRSYPPLSGRFERDLLPPSYLYQMFDKLQLPRNFMYQHHHLIISPFIIINKTTRPIPSAPSKTLYTTIIQPRANLSNFSFRNSIQLY
jgi:hypothetical protein